MDILGQLGINETFFAQLIIFILSLFILTQFVFKEFVNLIDQRDQKTGAADHSVEQAQSKTAEMQLVYENKAKEINAQIKRTFDKARVEASEEQEKILQQSRNQAMQLIEDSRRRISAEIGDAAKKIAAEAPIVAQAISEKLLATSPRAR